MPNIDRPGNDPFFSVCFCISNIVNIDYLIWSISCYTHVVYFIDGNTIDLCCITCLFRDIIGFKLTSFYPYRAIIFDIPCS